MIRHVVMWRLKPEAKRSGGPDNLERIEANLAAMRGAIAGLRRIELAVNQAAAPDAADLLLLADFDDWEALRGYESHALHDELRVLIGPIRNERRVVDYEL